MSKVLQPVYWLGSEYNATRFDGEKRTMQQQVSSFFRDGINGNPAYFKVLKAQIKAFGFDSVEQGIHFRDVSLEPAGGKQTPKDIYEEHVRKSISRHQRYFDRERPKIVVIGGIAAYKAFNEFVLPKLSERPQAVVRVPNPSPGGFHRGRADDWVAWYDSEFRSDTISDRVRREIQKNPGCTIGVEVKIKKNPRRPDLKVAILR